MRNLTLWEWLQCGWLSLWCPGFWSGLDQAMKDNAPGPWIACAILLWPMRRAERETKGVDGDLVAAYIVARRLALRWANHTNYAPGGHCDPPGVEFGIRRVV